MPPPDVRRNRMHSSSSVPNCESVNEIYHGAQLPLQMSSSFAGGPDFQGEYEYLHERKENRRPSHYCHENSIRSLQHPLTDHLHEGGALWMHLEWMKNTIAIRNRIRFWFNDGRYISVEGIKHACDSLPPGEAISSSARPNSVGVKDC
ncbi:hypothetical protein TNCV_1476121 [Trichonephila clavipes]|nr:hypothetical protein TNCV_1476121 [Trichonephila clavipes]